jgi:type IV pilus secretin PilQ/predicted competence protein
MCASGAVDGGLAVADPAAPSAVEAKVEAGAPAAKSAPVVTGVRIEALTSTENAITGELSLPAKASLKKTAPSEYLLSFTGASIDGAAANTLVAAPNTGAIRSIRTASADVGTGATFRIFASPNAELKLEEKGRQFVVRADGFGAREEGAGQDMRGQLDPKQAAAPADAAAPTTAAGGADAKNEVEISGPEVAPTNGDADLAALLDDSPKYTGRLISLDLQDTDIDNALRIIAEVSNLNIIASEDVAGKVTLRLIDVPWDQALDVILKTNALDKVQEGNVVRIAPVEKLRLEREALRQSQQAEEELEPLTVKYIRVSYAKAAELKPLIDTVVSERGSVSYDERTNQLIVKDIRKGLKNVVELVSKLDLRTPQILIETQIVEAKRDFSRELGAELGFQSIQSPETGNPTGRNFPNSINIVGSADDSGTFSSFPTSAGGAGISFLLGSADGSLSLNTRLTALENEGRGRVVSRPSVATTNNKQAVIKSVEKVRIKTPSGGVSVATGSGASASGSSAVATEVIEVGIILEVTPQASPDYYVLLDINAKSSTLGVARVDGIPGEIERSATSTVLVSSGQTFAMGGIYKIDDSTSIEGVPFFKDIPFLGHFFRSQLVDNGDEELLFFLTPRIVEGSFDDAAMKSNS